LFDGAIYMNNEKKILQAAVLKYDSRKDAAPHLTAKGRGTIAEKIIELAKKHDIPIKSDPALVQILSKIDIDEQIPVELYKAVAEILAFVYSLNTQRREARSS
jgi:flagellar biosynthesis protein